MRRHIIEVEVVLLDILAVVAFPEAKAVEPFFEKGIVAVPERGREAEELKAIADASDAVFAPAKSFTAGMLVRKIGPGIAIGAVVFAHRAPRPLRQIRSPSSPAEDVAFNFLEPFAFGVAHDALALRGKGR